MGSVTQVKAPAGLGIGALGGLIGISCWYGKYAWYLRGAGVVVGGGAVALYLRRRDQCDLRGARAQWRTIATAAVVGVVTYAALYALTTWLGSRAHA